MNDREPGIANHYHESTKRVYLPLKEKPPAYKSYPALPPLALPVEFLALTVPTLKAVSQLDGTTHAESRLDLTSLATLLFYSAGRIRKRQFAGVGEVTFRAASSAGGLYPIEVYLVCGDLPDLNAGVYHFSPMDFALRCLRPGDFRSALSQAVGGDATIAVTPVTLIYSAVFWRSAWKYQARAYRYCFWDNGTIAANALAVANELGLPAHVQLGFIDEDVNRLIGVDGQSEASLSLMSIRPANMRVPQTEAATALPISTETELNASEFIHCEEITRLHAASALATPGEVLAWRGAFDQQPEPRVEPVYPLDPQSPTSSPLGETIRQRGSTRRFAQESISLAQLSAILSSATVPVAADFLGSNGVSLLHIYLIINAVEGIPSGAYVYSPPDQTLGRLQAGDFRQQAGHLCFEQALGADASAVVFFMADLNGVLQRFGNRGYRAVQWEAGAIGGRMYLGAYALGLGASGLTFFDDEATDFFAPHAAGKSAIFVVALGHTASDNRVRPFRSRIGMTIDARSRRDVLT